MAASDDQICFIFTANIEKNKTRTTKYKPLPSTQFY